MHSSVLNKQMQQKVQAKVYCSIKDCPFVSNTPYKSKLMPVNFLVIVMYNTVHQKVTKEIFSTQFSLIIC